MNCLQIALINVPGWLPDHFYHSSNNVFFDIDPEEKFSMSKEVSNLTDFDTIKGDGVLGLNLPKTDKNVALVEGKGLPGAFEYDHYLLIPVRVSHGMFVERQNALRILTNNDKAQGYEADIIDENEFWKEILGNTRIGDVFLGSFTLSQANLEANWLDHVYNDGDAGVYFGLASYANWKNEAFYVTVPPDDQTILDVGTQVVTADFRPFFHFLFLMQKVFCAIGYEFRSPIFESDWGRQLVTYVLEDLSGSDGLEGFKYKAVTTEDYDTIPLADPSAIPGNPAFLVDTTELQAIDDYDLGYDRGGSPGFYVLNPSGTGNNKYGAIGLTGRHKIKVDITLDTTATGNKHTFQIVLLAWDGNTFIAGINSPTLLIDNERKRFRHEFEPATIDPTWRYTVAIDVINIFATGSADGRHTVVAGSSVENIPLEVSIEEDMLMPLSSFINYNLTGEDLLKAGLHLIGGGNIYTDHIGKTVWVYHPDQVVIWDGEEPEAFYMPDYRAEELEVLCNSEITKIQDRVNERYLRLAFKTPKDAWAVERGYSKLNPLYGRLIDFGANKGYKEKTKDSQNPLFESTLLVEAIEIQGTGDHAIHIPALWDNNDRVYSTKSEPRILYAAGLLEQVIIEDDGGGTPTLAEWRFHDTQRTAFPVMFQQSNHPYRTSGGDVVYFEQNVAYGEETIDLYKFWEQRLKEDMYALTIQYLSLIDAAFYAAENFRRPRRIYYDGRWALVKLAKISDFRPLERISTPIDVVVKLEENEC